MNTTGQLTNTSGANELMSGFFVSFEGIDGAGKSTHIDALAKHFQMQGRVVTLTREPGGTPLSEQLREMVLNEPMDAMTEVLLVFAARREHLCRVISPALARGEVVLCDRFTDATFAYQGAGRGFDLEILKILERWVQTNPAATATHGCKALIQPDLTFWFDLPAQVAAKRLTGARAPDKFEAQSQAFFERVSNGYAMRLAEDPERFARIDADQTPDLVWQAVERVIRSRGPLS